MRLPLKHVAVSLALTSLLTTGAANLAWADDAAAPAPAAATAVRPAGAVELASYAINDNLQLQVLGVLDDKNSAGARLGAAIRILNSSNDTVRIPDHELRLTASDGTIYSLIPSDSNVHGVPAMSQVDLTYLKQVNRQDDFQITDLSFVDVNYDYYPKLETTLASAPVKDQVWAGSQGVITASDAKLSWGTTFQVPTLNSPLTYNFVSITKSNTNSGSSFLVKLLVSNDTAQNETVPMFGVDGKTASGVYSGKRVETGPVSLLPGDKTYIHYVIDTDIDTDLQSLNVLALEPFTLAVPGGSGASQSSGFGIGKLNVALPASGDGAPTAAYAYGTPIAFQDRNDFVNPDLQVSLVELHATNSDDDGYRTALAKLKLTNHGEKPIPVPGLQAELVSGSNSYVGARQSAVMASVQPGTSAVVTYAFVMPMSDTGSDVVLKLQGSVQAGPSDPTYRSTVAELPVTMQPDEDHNSIHLYPYTLNVKSWILSPIRMNVSSYSYKLYLDMDLTRDPEVVLDNNFSTLKIELIDGLGRSVGSQTFPFTGVKRLVSGDQDLVFNNISDDQAESQLTVRISESIMTPNGEMDRVLANLQP